MPIITETDGDQLALYALGSALFLIALFNIPRIGSAIRAVFSFGLLALALVFLFQQAPFDPTLSRLMDSFGLGRQDVSGREVKIQMSPDGHFWATALINGVEVRLLVDSGASMTALSQQAAQQAQIKTDVRLAPVMIRTANGVVSADTGTIARLDIGAISAKDLKVIVSPSLGSVNVLGMNFLSQLASWRVEGRTLVLVPALEENR